MSERYLVVGGAGFIGSHFVDRLLAGDGVAGVTIYDNYSSGRAWHHAHHDDDPRFAVVRGEVEEHLPDKVYRTLIPRNIRLSEAPSHGKPVLLYFWTPE